ncbi:MAG TPA: putative baseplate assembly protein [Actinomycetes bacterium]
MTAEPPVLDGRTQGDVVGRLRELARDHLPEWRPPPEGDAGTALQHGFARLLELILQRLNQVPDKTLLAFLETMGVNLLAPAPARVPVTFTLTPGSPPTVVPAGSQVATGTGITFETEAQLTATTAGLVAAHTVDPVADRFADQTAATGGGRVQGFSPFTGTAALPHVLWLGSDALLDAGRPFDVALVLRYRSSRPTDEVARFFEQLDVGYRTRGTLETAHPSVLVEPGENPMVNLWFTVEPVDREILEAPGLDHPVSSGWLRIGLPAPLHLTPVAQDLRVNVLAMSVNASEVPPQAAARDDGPLDTSKDFLPLGEYPRVGDAFYLSSDEVFGKAGGTAWIWVEAGSGTAKAPELVWEYLGAGGWTALELMEGTGIDFTVTNSAVTEPLPAVPRGELDGQEGRWVRVRLTAGGYGQPAEYEPVPNGTGFRVKAGTGDLDPPRVKRVALSYSVQAEPAVLRQTGTVFTDLTAAQRAGADLEAFVSPAALPEPLADRDPALYLGFDDLPAERPVTLYVAAAAPGLRSGRVVMRPPVAAPPSSPLRPAAWDYFDGSGWRPLAVLDGTRHLTTSGTVVFLAPADAAPLARFGREARTWVRARAGRDDPTDPRRLAGVFLNAVPAVQGATVADEPLGSSGGQPGQTLRLARPPVLPGQRLEVREPERPSGAERQVIELEEGPDAVRERLDAATGRPEVWVRWREVPNFVRSGPASRHYTLDRLSGTVTFGDGTRGLIPPRGAGNVHATYRTSAGPAGNVPAGSVTQLVSPLPAVARVTNPVAADGGAAAETVAGVRARGPQALRHRDRAIAGGDFEWLARQAAGTRVARATCLPNVNRDLRFEPGWVTLVVIPQGEEPKLEPGAELVATIERQLAARASAGLVQSLPGRVNVIGPGWVQVAVAADVVPWDLAMAEEAERRVVAALGRFLHPLTGGPAGAGWELGRDVYASEVAQVIERVPGVSHVTRLRLVPGAVQRRLAFAASARPIARVAAAEGSGVVTPDLRKAARLAAPVVAATLVDGLVVRGLEEGQRLAVVLDVRVAGTEPQGVVHGTPSERGSPFGFPAGSLVVAADGRSTRLVQGLPRVPPSGAPQDIVIRVEDVGLAGQLAAGDRLTIFAPSPVTVAGVAPGPPGVPVFTARLVPYDTDATLPAGTVLAAVDGPVRVPLAAGAAPDPVTGTIDSLALEDFASGDEVLVESPDAGTAALVATVEQVTAVDDIVYLDPNVCVYAREHQIRMTGR